jgi:hypothetical protein
MKTKFFPSLTLPATMETLALLLLVAMQRNNTGVVSVSMGLFDYDYLVTTRRLHSKDDLRSNTSQYSASILNIFRRNFLPNILFKKPFELVIC